MKILNIWDWKFRLSLCESTFKRVNDFTDNLNRDEQKIYKDIIDFYNSFYSFDVLLELLIEEKLENKQTIKTANKNIDKAIKVPFILENYYRKKIELSFKNNLYMKEQLDNILTSILDNDGCCIETGDIQNKIFGQYYPEIKKTILQKKPIIKKGNEIIETGDIKLYANQLLSKIQKDETIVSNFGKSIIENYDISIIKDQGFAEWWDRDLVDGTKDLLVLYDNKDALNRDDFEYTIYHEVYPGHGQFYNYARLNSETIPGFDHGAMSLIEGWATYCEWNVKQTSYSKTLRERGKSHLEISLAMPNKRQDEKVELIYNNKIKRGYTEEQAISSVLYFSQYPGFVESYYLGALCIEEILKNKDIDKPAKFLRYLKDKTWGELFALWG